jgi:hypothetical protein
VVAADQPTLPAVQMIRLAQNPDQNALARGNAMIRGRVMASDGRRVPHALLRLFPQNDPLQTRGLIADNEGRFEFGERPAGTF